MSIWQWVVGLVGYALCGTVFLALVLRYSERTNGWTSHAAEVLFLVLWPLWIGVAFLAAVFGGLIRLATWLSGAKA